MNSKREVLVVDANPELGHQIAHFLEGQGFGVQHAHSGFHALQAVQAKPCDILIVNDNLGDVSGLELINAIAERYRYIRSVLLTDADGEHPGEERIERLPHPIDWELLHHTVDQAAVRLQAERLQEDLMSTVAHDLKIPLTSILGCCSLLLGHTVTEEHRKEEVITCIQRNGYRIQAMLENYLTMVRARSGQLALSLSNVDPRALVNDLLYAMQFEARRRLSHLSSEMPEDLPATIRADEHLLNRALANLLSNALKYSPWEADVVVTLTPRLLSQGGENVEALEFAVTNPGRGIPPEDLAHVFDRYHRVKSNEAIEGCGLGLSVVKTVAEAHDGIVSVESTMNVTTTFRVILPVNGPLEN